MRLCNWARPVGGEELDDDEVAGLDGCEQVARNLPRGLGSTHLAKGVDSFAFGTAALVGDTSGSEDVGMGTVELPGALKADDEVAFGRALGGAVVHAAGGGIAADRHLGLMEVVVLVGVRGGAVVVQGVIAKGRWGGGVEAGFPHVAKPGGALAHHRRRGCGGCTGCEEGGCWSAIAHRYTRFARARASAALFARSRSLAACASSCFVSASSLSAGATSSPLIPQSPSAGKLGG